jgi:spore coat protein U-like protein
MRPIAAVMSAATISLATTLPSQAASCTVLLSLMAFGVYDTILPAANHTSANIQVTCTPGLGNPLKTLYTITIAGTGSGNDSVRAVASGAYRLYYQVYTDPAYSTVWGNGGSSGPGVTSSVTSLSDLLPAMQVHTAHARMPALQIIPPGIYTGSLLVTIDY